MVKNRMNSNERCVNGWMIGIFVFFAVIILFGIFFPRRKFTASLENFEPGYEPYMEHFHHNKQGGSGNKKTVALFYAPWCGHCKRCMPDFEKLMSKYRGHPDLEVVKINCDDDQEAAKRNQIQGFPTIKYFPNGYNDTTTVIEYEGDRSYDDLDRFIQENLSN